MTREESLRQTDHYRCRLCGQLSPITETLCTKPGCRAQLGIYGEIITGEAQTHAPVKPIPVTEEHEVNVRQKEDRPKKEKPVREKKAPRVKKEKPAVYTEATIAKPFMRKKTLMVWLNVIFLLVYSAMAYLGEFSSDYFPSIENVIYGAGIVLVITALAVFLLCKEKYILHGIVCIFNGAVSFMVAGGLLSSEGYTGPMFVVMMAAYIWLGILSFVYAPRKKRIKTENLIQVVDPVVKKAPVLICMDVLLLLIYATMRYTVVEMIGDLYGAMSVQFFSGWVWIDVIVPVVGILLLCKKKYVLHGILLCAYGALTVVFQWGNWLYFVILIATMAVLYIWLGVISFLKEE